MAIHRIAFFLLISLHLHLCFSHNSHNSHNSQILKVEDGAWCWFSDPRAIYHKGSKEMIYFGLINKKGDVIARSYDLESKEHKEFVLHKELQIDDHNVPSFLILPNGNILAFYNHHNGNIFMRKSKNAESIAEWEEEVVLLQKNDSNLYSYTNPIMLSEENNRIYLFGRNIVRHNNKGRYTDTRTYCIYSDDYGETWSKEYNILNNDGRDSRQYVKITSDNKSRIDFLLTDGHPNRNDISVYHMYYKNGAFWQTDNKKIGPFNESPVLISKVNKVYDATESNVRSWIWDIAIDKKTDQ